MYMAWHRGETEGKSKPLASDDPLRNEADHRIANNLALIVGLVRMRARAVVQKTGPMDREEVRLLLDDVASRVDTVARLHRMLSRPSRQTLVDLADYLEEICSSLTASLSAAGRVVLRHNSDVCCLLPPDQVLTVGLVISELMTNSVKYAHPSGVAVKIEVNCRYAADGALVVSFADDGIGLPDGFDPRVDGALGFRLVRSLAKQLDATISFEHDSMGTTFRMRIPRSATAIAPE
jgi:two-component sensor histidine kinase